MRVAERIYYFSCIHTSWICPAQGVPTTYPDVFLINDMKSACGVCQ